MCAYLCAIKNETGIPSPNVRSGNQTFMGNPLTLEFTGVARLHHAASGGMMGGLRFACMAHGAYTKYGTNGASSR